VTRKSKSFTKIAALIRRKCAAPMVALVLIEDCLLLHAQTGASRQVKIPRFEDFPVTEKWEGSAAPLKLKTTPERMFVTRLTDASKQPPDFAGHYRFAGWGCGSVCAAGAIIDLNTGVVYPPPFGRKGTGAAHWIFTYGPFP